ncbi:inward rectifier potassium channel [Bacteriovorax sp. BSW11_IV]|uniref:ion channel n=1 Tax=Bacteriovorax sp. BSW11_IV TaxID=1353529 RepID=UPI00038A5375|nr:ion channel [Bacteriovorax sp. BSW11_IV]EQC43015.1 inward rectifier potassium channel [Bacteriovorax sp. BSW11_IV]
MRENLYNIKKKNAPLSLKDDLYFHLMKLSWAKFILFFLLVYFSLNIIFATLYFVMPNSISGEHTFLNSFFFSVQTLSTVGYGSIHPISFYGNLISVIEMFSGMLSIALMTGLIFSKFSLPKVHIMFTKNMIITNFEGQRALMFRLANARSNRIMNAEIGLTMLYDTVSKEGIHLRKFEELKLRKSKTPFFSLSLTGVHIIDENSPLFEMSDEKISSSTIELVVSLLGLDDTYGQTIHAVKMYQSNDIICGARFADILNREEDGSRTIDFANFNKVYEE